MKKLTTLVAFAALMIFAAGCHTPGGDQVKGDTAPGKTATRQEKLSVDLFVMSQCPYGIQAENIVIPLSAELGSRVDLKLYFVGEEIEAGVPHSLHGEAEVKADLYP